MSFSLSLSETSQAVVGYCGSVELPEVEENNRQEAISAVIRLLRVDKRVRRIVLLRLQPKGITCSATSFSTSLFSSSKKSQNNRPPVFYSTSIIAICGAYSVDRRFFAVVTCTGSIPKNSSCHVFVVEPKWLSHPEHERFSREFCFICTTIPVSNNIRVLGLQKCVEFPATADPILSSITRLCFPPNGMTMDDTLSQPQNQQRSPSVVSNCLESNSNESVSDIEFRGDNDALRGQIYELFETISSASQEVRHLSSVSTQKRFPISYPNNNNNSNNMSNQNIQPQPCSSNSCLPTTSINCSGGGGGGASHSSSSPVSNPSCFFSDRQDDNEDDVDFQFFESDPNSKKRKITSHDPNDYEEVGRRSLDI